VPTAAGQPPGGLDAGALEASSWSPSVVPTVYVCGPSDFVDHITGLMQGLGHDVGRIRTERFGRAAP
jgi:ferredoxin-NADP reductase